MLSRQNALILAAILFGTLALSVIFVAAHSSFYTCINEAADSYRAEHYQTGAKTIASLPLFNGYATCAARVARHDGDAITALATALLAIITLGIVFLGLEQSRTTRAQLRAYIAVSVGSAIYQERPKGLRFEGRPVIRNYGSTPAYNVSSWVRADIIPDTIVANYNFNVPQTYVAQAPIGPREERVLSAVVASFVNDAEVDDIKQGVAKSLWAWGEIQYTDAFGDLHKTQFSQRLTWLPDGSPFAHFGPFFSEMT